MEIEFKTKRLRKRCTDSREMDRHWGAQQAQRIRRRLDQMRAAENLDVLRNLPGRCHELTGDRSGQLSVDVVHPYRLLFEVANEPVPQKDDGGLDWTQVTAVRILEVEDTHG